MHPGRGPVVALSLGLSLGCGSTESPGQPADAGDERSNVEAGPADASTGDASGDAGLDGARDAEAGGGRWCDTLAPKPAFCDDFDRNDLNVVWDAVVQTTGSALALDQANFRSPPQALAVRSKNAGSNELGNVLVRKTVAGAPARAKLSFDFLGDPAPASGGPVAIATLDMSTSHLFTLYLRDADPTTPGPALVEQPPAGPSVRHPFTPPSLAQWVRIEIEVDLSAQKASLRFDANAALNQVSIATSTANGPTLRLGVLTTGPQPAYSARFDNVTLELP
jgi:hypothetical protein